MSEEAEKQGMGFGAKVLIAVLIIVVLLVITEMVLTTFYFGKFIPHSSGR